MSQARTIGGPLHEAAAGPADYLALLKPRVMSLVCFTGFAGMVLAPGSLHPTIAFTALLCIAVAAGASGAINMWCDRDIDALMERTRNRPIPAGRVRPHAVQHVRREDDRLGAVQGLPAVPERAGGDPDECMWGSHRPALLYAGPPTAGVVGPESPPGSTNRA